MAKTRTRTESDAPEWEALVNGNPEQRREFARLWQATHNEEAGIVHHMALQNYHLIQLQESTNPKYKFGAQYVGINEWKAFLPRETPILVSDAILQNLKNAENYGRPEDRREDVRIMTQGGAVDCFTAHKKRLKGEVRVYPERLPKHVKNYLEKEL